MHMGRANLSNLIGLWSKYGAKKISGDASPTWYANTRWPYRVWFDWGCTPQISCEQTQISHSDIGCVIDALPREAIVPVWPMINERVGTRRCGEHDTPIEQRLVERGWGLGFKQTAMYLPLSEASSPHPTDPIGFGMRRVRTAKEVGTWVEIGSQAFGYAIDGHVIESLLGDSDIQVLLGIQNGQALAGGLLYKTGEVIAVHQLGVRQACQGQGIARRFIRCMLAECVRWQGKYVVLQASQAGKPLYDQLGFHDQFVINNYQKV